MADVKGPLFTSKTETLLHRVDGQLLTTSSGLPAWLGNWPERVQFHGDSLNMHCYMWWKENELKYKHGNFSARPTSL